MKDALLLRRQLAHIHHLSVAVAVMMPYPRHRMRLHPRLVASLRPHVELVVHADTYFLQIIMFVIPKPVIFRVRNLLSCPSIRRRPNEKGVIPTGALFKRSEGSRVYFPRILSATSLPTLRPHFDPLVHMTPSFSHTAPVLFWNHSKRFVMELDQRSAVLFAKPVLQVRHDRI